MAGAYGHGDFPVGNLVLKAGNQAAEAFGCRIFDRGRSGGRGSGGYGHEADCEVVEGADFCGAGRLVVFVVNPALLVEVIERALVEIQLVGIGPGIGAPVHVASLVCLALNLVEIVHHDIACCHELLAQVAESVLAHTGGARVDDVLVLGVVVAAVTDGLVVHHTLGVAVENRCEDFLRESDAADDPVNFALIDCL